MSRIPAPPRPPVVGRIMEVGQITVDGHEYPRAMLVCFESVEQLRRAMNEDRIQLRVDLGVGEDQPP